MPLSRKTTIRCLLRTAHINAATTARGMQQIGLSYVLAPALRELYPEADAQREAFGRYAEHSNTHVFMLPAYAGMLLFLEQGIARGKIPKASMHSIQQPLATALSALGDGFFSGSLRTLWALSCICLILGGCVWGAVAFTALLFCLLLAFRVSSFLFCLKRGMRAVRILRGLDLATWTDRLKRFNALLACAALWLLFSGPLFCTPGWMKLLLLVGLPCSAWLAERKHLSRELLAFAGLGLFVLFRALGLIV